jgi:4-hydroxy-tetrahydrodipicolinate synthase
MSAAKKKEGELRGVIPAVITPLRKDGKVHEKLLEKHVTYLSRAGVHGFLVNGTTGEGPFLSKEERRRTFRIVRAASGKGQFLCLGCLLPSTELTLEEILAFKSLKPDFIVVTSPYYFKVTQEEMIRHFEMIARRSPFPVIVYNIPQCTHNKIEHGTMLQIASLDNVVGFKDSSGDFITFSRVLSQGAGEDFAWIMGEDYLDAAGLMIGARGMVTGLGNVWVEPYVEMYRAAGKGDFEKVLKCQQKINRLYEVIRTARGRGVPAVKAAASLLGRSETWLKEPLLPVNDEEFSRIERILRNLGLNPSVV